MDWFLMVLKKYAVFEGRARRKEYWMFTLIWIIISVVLTIIDTIIGTMVLNLIVSLALVIPSLALSVRRLHDVGKSGFMIFIALIPIIGFLILLFFAVKEGDQGDNQYGPDPKA
ncbi:MAG: DUF805 domain-containing protein [Candidatus Kapabacteria bacterium]|nr:DUF805 domain-containing protein [Candidatus Kapabacteria bacterium]